MRATISDRRLGRFVRDDAGHAPAVAPTGEAPAVENVETPPTQETPPVIEGLAAADSAAESSEDSTLLTDLIDGAAKEAVDGDGDGEAGDKGEGEEPAPYEGLTAPEGFAGIDTEALTAATPLMRQFGVADDRAQEFLDAAAPVIAGMMERAGAAAAQAEVARRAEITAGWVAEIQADPVIGGANFERSKAMCGLALNKFASEGFRQYLQDTGLGNHPEMMRTFASIGNTIKDDDVDVTGAVAGAPKAHHTYNPLFLPPDQRA